MKLWLVRHARPVVPAGVCYGASDVAADEAATLQAAQALAAVLPQGVPVRSSPRRRCVRLATALERLRPDLSAQADARLAELDFGCWEGQSWNAIGTKALERWQQDFANHRCGGGESVADLMGRVGEAWDAAIASGAEQVWITHGGVVRAARLLSKGVRMPRVATDWPLDSLDFGAWTCLSA